MNHWSTYPNIAIAISVLEEWQPGDDRQGPKRPNGASKLLKKDKLQSLPPNIALTSQ
jgi:hypothetical protein